MIITSLKKKGRNIYSIYVDGEYMVDVDKEIALSHKIKVGQNVTDEELLEIVKESDNRFAKKKALYLLSYRDYSKKELIRKITRVSNEEAANQAANKMEELGFINDNAFCKKRAQELLFVKNYSKKRVEYELLKKGIDRDLIEKVLDDVDIDSKKMIENVVKKKYINYLKDEKGKKKLVIALKRLGYNWEEIKSGLSKFLTQEIYE